MATSLEQKPPLGLGIEIETAEGATFRLDADQLRASNIPTGISFSTQRGEGFSTATFTLNREIFREYPDLNLLDTVRVIGQQGVVAYEGRIQSFPRSSNPQTITVQCVGWMTYLKNRPMSALIADRRLSSWAEPSTQRKASLYGGAEKYRLEGRMGSGWQASGAKGPAITFQFSTFDATYIDLGEAWFHAGGEDIGGISAKFEPLEGGAASKEWHSFAYVSDDDLATVGVEKSVPDVHNSANVIALLSTSSGRKYAILQNYIKASASATLAILHGFLYPLVIGTHGLTAHGEFPEQGYYVSDIIQYLLRRFAPKIDWQGKENQFILTQCTWHDSPKTPYDAIQQLNNYVLWETNVWEERKFYFEPADLTKADWQIRTTDPGVSVQFQGDSIASFANGVIVTYSDFFGHTYTLYPDAHAELRDESENNPANRHNEDLWVSYTIPWQCLEAEAIQFGRAYLAENNRPKRPGTFTVQGYIRDRAGHWNQAWKVRNSQTLSIVDDQYEGEPRLITATSYDAESATLSITVDAPPSRVEAIVARQQHALEARNLNSAP